MNAQRKIYQAWFKDLRDQICQTYENIETEYAKLNPNVQPGRFERISWDRPEGGGGEMSVMRGNVFEKVGVNFSAVHGEFSNEFAKEIPGTSTEQRDFFATGISLVSHMVSPLVPAAHFNTRYIATSKGWFGGGGDLTPIYPNDQESTKFHQAFKNACDAHDASYYSRFKKECDEYFFLKHRNEPRGIGGIFFDYLNSGDMDKDFAFVQDVGRAFRDVYAEIIRHKMHLPWTTEQREVQLKKRGRYVEFNLLYDRGTRFGLMTGGNTEAILMSLPPEVKW